MKAIITVGVSGSGKTTWAKKQFGFAIISRDDIRAEIYYSETGKPFEWSGWKWSKEDDVTAIQNNKFETAAKNEYNIIVADTNLNKGRANDLKKKLEGLGYSVEFHFFHGDNSEENVDIETCIKRDASRSLSVGSIVINKQWKQMLDSWGDSIVEKYREVEGLGWSVIFDIDGTLADHKGFRSPFDWGSVGKDRVRDHVAELLRFYSDSGYTIIILSGRDSVCRVETEDWLNKNKLHYYALYMRNTGDSRKDVIVKKELFDNYIRNNWNVRVVVDDRKQVLQLWHDLGLNVLNVGHINDYF